MSFNLILSIFFLTLSMVLIKIFGFAAQGTLLMDKPNNRSMHSREIVRGGGIVFIGLSLISLPILCYLTQTPFREQFVFALSILLIALVSFWDDLYHLSARLRFLVQSIVALLILGFLCPKELDFVFFSITTSWIIVPFVFIAVLWAINHFNFMDGIDGFCASQALFLFLAYALLFGMQGALFYQSFCLILVSTLAGFLVFNFPPAKLFMGDVGSASLGLISFALALIAQQKFQIPILYWFMLNGLFLFDATFTLIRRIMKNEKWSMPHKKHAYQRATQSGIPVPIILLGQLLINVSFFILVLVLKASLFSSFYLFLFQCIFIFLIYYLIEKKFPMV